MDAFETWGAIWLFGYVPIHFLSLLWFLRRRDRFPVSGMSHTRLCFRFPAGLLS
jgi:hypothetical protein